MSSRPRYRCATTRRATSASVLLGQVGQITGHRQAASRPASSATALYKGVTAGSIVGQSGLEAEYQPYLQGIPGEDKVEINASGYPTGAVSKPPVQPVPGDQLGHLDRCRRPGARGLRRDAPGRWRRRRTLHNPATAAAFVAMNPFTGRVYALGSLPTYNANEFATGVSTSQYKTISGEHADIDRAIEGHYPGPGRRSSRSPALGALLGAGRDHAADRWQGAGPAYTVGHGAAAQFLPQLRRRQLRQPRSRQRAHGLGGHLLLLRSVRR